DEGIDDGEENDVRRHRPEVGDAFRYRVLQIRKPDLADDWISRALARTGEHMEIGHSEPPSAVLQRSRGRGDAIFPLPTLVTPEPRLAERHVTAAAGDCLHNFHAFRYAAVMHEPKAAGAGAGLRNASPPPSSAARSVMKFAGTGVFRRWNCRHSARERVKQNKDHAE